MAIVPEWLLDSAGIILPDSDALRVFVHVLWMESCGQRSDAEHILKKAQDDFIMLVCCSCC